MSLLDPNHIHATEAADAREKAVAAGLDPSTVQLIVNLVLQYGPKFYDAIVALFKHNPKPA